MEHVKAEQHTKKRTRVDSNESDSSSVEGRRVKLISGLNSPESTTAGTESRLNPSDPNPFRLDILDILEEPEMGTAGEPVIVDLDSVIRSFEEEILPSPAQKLPVNPVSSVEYGGSRLDFGYLFEASDDDLGLPPVLSSSGVSTTNDAFDFAGLPEAGDLGEILGVECEFPSGDSFGVGSGSEFDSVGGFGYDDDGSDLSEFLWRPDFDSSLHAL